MDHVQELVMPVLARDINVVAFSNAKGSEASSARDCKEAIVRYCP
jgi:hypothetical protein